MSNTTQKIELHTATEIANMVKNVLAPHCDRIEIAGSIRRKVPLVGDIEIVCIPKPYETGLFASGIATVINNWKKNKGELPCKYTQRELPSGIKLDIFMVTPQSWGVQFAIRTGSAAYSHKKLASKWKALGYTSKEGILYHRGKPCPIYEEIDLFKRLHIPYVEPENRNL